MPSGTHCPRIALLFLSLAHQKGNLVKNAIVHIGNLYRDHGALKRAPERVLREARKKIIEKHGPIEGYMFGRMNDDGEYKVVSIDGIVLDHPLPLDIRTGRHTGFHEKGLSAGAVKGAGPNATDIDDVAAANLLADIVAVNRKQDVPRQLKSEREAVAPIPPLAAEKAPAESAEAPLTMVETPPGQDPVPGVLLDFERAVAGLPRTTEAERLTVERVGQPFFRRLQLARWGSRCALTGLALPELLRASHLKPWAKCESDAERLDVANGLLLSPNLDAALDKGFITLTDEGKVLVSSQLDTSHRTLLGLDEPLQVTGLGAAYLPYLSWHREIEFKP